MPDPADSPPLAPSQAGREFAPSTGAVTDRGELALVLTGGGARGAYQVGLLRYLARTYPELRIPIQTGVSAGAINVALLAQHHGTFRQAADELAGLWAELIPERIFRVDMASLAGNIGRWGLRLTSGGMATARTRALVDTAPLRQFLEEALAPVHGELTGIDYNLQRGNLRAVAISTTDYTTGQSVIWTQGREVETWERPGRISRHCRITVDHVMASAALPLFFPAVQIGPNWYGDGGIRLTAPLSPALHLGASKILTVSTRYDRSRGEASTPEIVGYPPPAQVIGLLLDAVFLELVDQDVARMERMNVVLDRIPPERREGMRIVEVLVMRPSKDLARIAAEYEPRLPRAFRLLTRGLGTRETRSPDVLSMIMFQDDYAKRLMSLGESDAERRGEEIDRFINGHAGERGAA
ncbi:MAG: patatin-like phospholipase family protein [Gemmatimonadetes bacterium]|nr:patatin-like phospholipase family protein [Gemmatimonadota bacterium]